MAGLCDIDINLVTTPPRGHGEGGAWLPVAPGSASRDLTWRGRFGVGAGSEEIHRAMAED